MAARSLLVASLCLAVLDAAAAQESTPTPPNYVSTESNELPEIEVTAPSPIKAPAKPKRTTKTEPAQAGPAKPKRAAAQATGSSAVPEAPEAPPVPAPAAGIEAAPRALVISVESFAPVTIASEDEIARNGGATITDTLAAKPGIAASTFAPGASRPIVRGLDNYRVRVQENGIGSHDVSALSEDHAVPIDPASARRVEVVRGPATLRYGSQAIGGVVAVENERVPTFIPKSGVSGRLSGGLMSVDDGRDGSFEATAGSDGVAVHADGFKRSADDYDTPRGAERNSWVESEGGSVGASRVGSDGFAGVALVRTESQYGIPAETSHIELVQDKVLSAGEWRLGSAGVEAVRFWLGASDYAHNEIAEEGDVGSRFTNTEEEARAEVQHVPVATALGVLRGAAGIQWGHRNMRGQSFEGDSLLEPARTVTIAGFLFEELELGRRLRFQAAARIEQANIDGFGIEDPLGVAAGHAFERSFTPVSASVGFLYELPMDVVARLTGQYVERAPDAAELFSKGVHEATGTFEIGNPGLEMEKAEAVELGFRRARGALRFDASAYYTRFDGFIFKELTGAGCGDVLASCGVEDELEQLVFGQRDATFYGVEIASQYDIARLWRGLVGIDGQYDYVRGRFADGENVQRIPPQRAGGGFYYRDPSWFLRVGLLHAFAQGDLGINETPTAAYDLVSAEIAYTTSLQGHGALVPEMTIGIKGENLLDDEVRNHTSFKKDEVLEPGASVRLYGSLKLN